MMRRTDVLQPGDLDQGPEMTRKTDTGLMMKKDLGQGRGIRAERIDQNGRDRGMSIGLGMKLGLGMR